MVPVPTKPNGFPSCISLSIEFNLHANYYETAEQWLAGLECPPDWVSDAERAKALAENSVWVCQWYPTTPIGFHALAASSFEALMAGVSASDSSAT